MFTSHNDHRIAMACAVAALSAKGKQQSACRSNNKSYPAFFDDLKKLKIPLANFIRYLWAKLIKNK